MQYTEIAISKPFEGAPKINLADIFGASLDKPIILKIPVTGKRPITYGAKNLPEGLVLKEGIITGKVTNAGVYNVTLTAENKLGKDEKTLQIEIGEIGPLLTPLLGYNTWNAYATDVTQEDVENVAKQIVETGIAEYGYSYVNIDSGWQGEYGGKFDAVMPNKKFPDMKKLCDVIHSLGLKSGMYSTPMLRACGNKVDFYPGCTQGEPDDLYAPFKGGIGKIRKEKSNALQWAEWGFDYLKYDWGPCEPSNTEIMRKALKDTDRDFGLCVVVGARPEYINYWSKYCSSYRNGVDTEGNWHNFLEVYACYLDYIHIVKKCFNNDYKEVNKGHFFDLDMLDTGFPKGRNLTKDEQILIFSLRAFMSSPIQISSKLESIDEFELSLYCNEEILAINQDTKFSAPRPYLMIEEGQKRIHVYKRKLKDNSYAIMILNLGETCDYVNIILEDVVKVRDVWAKKDMGETDFLRILSHPHTARIFKMTE